MSNLDADLAKLRIDKNRKRPRQGIARGWLVVGAMLIVAGVVYFVFESRFAPVRVKAAQVECETMASDKGAPVLNASGYVVPRRKIEVSSKIVGWVKDILVERGDQVKEGDVLLRLDDAEYQARVASAEAQAAALKARLAEFRAGSRPQEIAAAKAAAASSEATLTNAELELQRMEALNAKGAASRQELDRARAARDVARAQLDASKKQAELVQIGPRPEEIAAAEALLRQAEAELDSAKTQLEYTVIRAPISGTILEKVAERGELVTNSNFGGTRGAKSSVVSMADLGDLQVEIDLNENDLSKVHLDQPCEIRLDSDPEHVYSGTVVEISPQADRQKGTVQVKVRLLNPESSIKTEVNARVTFLAPASADTPPGESKTRMWIPRGAVQKRGQESIVYVLSNGKAAARPVTLGIEGEKGIEVTAGLAGAETVIVAPPAVQVSDGVRVVVEPEKK